MTKQSSNGSHSHDYLELKQASQPATTGTDSEPLSFWGEHSSVSIPHF